MFLQLTSLRGLSTTPASRNGGLLCWASHERASALRPETAHCRSLISHNRRAVFASCASGLGGLCSWSKKYTPLTFATSGEVASHTRVSAPFSGLRDTGLRIVIPKSISRPLLRLNSVATSPGWKQFAVTPSRQFSREQDVSQLGFAVAAKAPVGALGVEIVERDVCSLMRLGCRSDDAGRCALFQPLEEELAEQKRRQVVDRPGQFDAVLRRLPCSVHGASVVDEHIQFWIAGQHLGGQSAHRDLRREVGDECRHRRSPPGHRLDASQRQARPGLAATDDGEVRAECGERFCRCQPNAISGTRDQNLLVVHGTAIQGYGDARMICSMVKNLALMSSVDSKPPGMTA